MLQFGHTKHVPLESATSAPRASVDPAIYIPPALRHGCAAWYPEVGKAWEAWGANVSTYHLGLTAMLSLLNSEPMGRQGLGCVERLRGLIHNACLITIWKELPPLLSCALRRTPACSLVAAINVGQCYFVTLSSCHAAGVHSMIAFGAI